MPTLQKVQRTVDVPQVQCIDRIVDVLVILQREVRTNRAVQSAVSGALHRRDCGLTSGDAEAGARLSEGSEDRRGATDSGG